MPVSEATEPRLQSPAGPGEELHTQPVHLLEELQDELTRSRMREAFWMSLFFHLALIIAILTAPQWMPEGYSIVAATPAQLMQNRDLTYLQMPADEQKVTQRPQTDKISDKDRIASSRMPPIDKDALERIRDNYRRGAPGAPAAPPVNQPPQQAMQQGGQPSQQQQQTSEQARLESPQARPGGGLFRNPMSAGSQIEQAARAAAASRGAMGGDAGDYGLGMGRQPNAIRSNAEILSDTMGVDFGPYLARVVQEVRLNWLNLIPEVARPPLMKRGRVSIEFAIVKDGSVAGLRLDDSSGDSSLDRAAWGGITASNPFPPLPGEFGGEYLKLRFHFFYNPDTNELK